MITKPAILQLPHAIWEKEIASYLPLEDRSRLSKTCKYTADPNHSLVLGHPDTQQRITTIQTECTQLLHLYRRAFSEDAVLPLMTVINDLSSEEKAKYLPALQKYQSIFDQWWLANGHTLRRGNDLFQAQMTSGPMVTRAISKDRLLLAEAIDCAFEATNPIDRRPKDYSLSSDSQCEIILDKHLKKQDIANAERFLGILFNIPRPNAFLQRCAEKLLTHYLEQNNPTKAQELYRKKMKNRQLKPQQA